MEEQRCQPLTNRFFALFIPIQGIQLQNDTIVSMELHSNPVATTQNIRTQINVNDLLLFTTVNSSVQFMAR